MQTLEGFNEGNLPRLSYLSGTDPKYRTRFWMQTPVFIRRTPQDTSTQTTHLHPWVTQVDHDSKTIRANPDRPHVWMKAGDATVPISERASGTLQRGDTVAVSFTVTYHLTAVNWFAQFHPVDIVMLKEGQGDATDFSAPALDLHRCPPPTLDTIPEEGEWKYI